MLSIPENLITFPLINALNNASSDTTRASGLPAVLIERYRGFFGYPITLLRILKTSIPEARAVTEFAIVNTYASDNAVPNTVVIVVKIATNIRIVANTTLKRYYS
jgi:hypothetical protein